MNFIDQEIFNLRKEKKYAKDHPHEFNDRLDLLRMGILLSIILATLWFNPIYSTDCSFCCPYCEREIGVELKDSEKSWRCKRCHMYNSKSNPPYKCGSCGCKMGEE